MVAWLGSRARWARVWTCLALVGATALVHAAMDTTSAAASGQLSVPDPAHAKALALGFEPVIADYFWLQAIQVIGGSERDPEAGPLIAELIDLVTTLDPWVDHPYRFAALWLTGSPEEVQQANRFLEKGIAYHPRDWRDRFYLGYNHFFHLNDAAAAADALETAVPLPGSPPYLGAFVTRLRASSDSLETAAIFLEQLARDTEDEYARAAYLQALDEIETERRARFLDAARALFRERHGRDIRKPAELWNGPLRVIDRAPAAHPQLESFTWELDPSNGRIVSTAYGSRYQVHIHPYDAERREAWRQERSS